MSVYLSDIQGSVCVFVLGFLLLVLNGGGTMGEGIAWSVVWPRERK